MRFSLRFKPTLRRTLATSAIAAMALHAVSCGTLIHPERCGQRSGRLDPSIVMLDGLALLVFIVPGVIGFAVDFGTGAIYLPERYGPYPPPYFPPNALPAGAPAGMTRIDTDPATLNQAKIEWIVRERTGKNLDLAAPNVSVRPVSNLEQANSALSDASPRQ